MEDRREFLTYRICANIRYLKLDNLTIKLGIPDADTKFIAEEIYWEAFNQAVADGLYDEASYFELLLERQLWSNIDEDRMLELPKIIEDLKINIFQSILKTNDRNRFRKELLECKRELYSLRKRRNILSYATCAGAANLAKTQYLILQSILNKDLTPNAALVHNIADKLAAERLTEIQYRDLAQNDPWRSIWSCCGDKNPFGKPVADWTEEQITIVSWAKLYDSVYGHSESPHSSVIEDNDMLDGWLLLQRRNRDAELEKRAADDLIPDSMKECGEVFVVAQTLEDAKRIDNLNDGYGKAIKQSRINALKKEGQLRHDQLPDVQQEIGMEYNRMTAERFRK